MKQKGSEEHRRIEKRLKLAEQALAQSLRKQKELAVALALEGGENAEMRVQVEKLHDQNDESADRIVTKR